jgi:hypothetical protein
MHELAVPHLPNLGLFTKRNAVFEHHGLTDRLARETARDLAEPVQVNSAERWYVVMAREEWSSSFLRCESST